MSYLLCSSSANPPQEKQRRTERESVQNPGGSELGHTGGNNQDEIKQHQTQCSTKTFIYKFDIVQSMFIPSYKHSISLSSHSKLQMTKDSQRKEQQYMQIFHNENIYNNIFYIIFLSSTSFHKQFSGVSNTKLNSWKVIPIYSARPRCRAASDVTGGCQTTKQEDKGKVREERCLGSIPLSLSPSAPESTKKANRDRSRGRAGQRPCEGR